MRSLGPCNDSSATPSFPSQLEGKIGLPRANPRGRLRSPCNSRMPPQLEKNHVVPTSWQDEALARDGVSREVPCSTLKGEKDPASLHATPKSSPTRRVPSRGTPRVPQPLPLSPFSPPDRDRRVDSPAWSGRGSRPSGAPKDEAGLTRKLETSHVGGATCRMSPIP